MACFWSRLQIFGLLSLNNKYNRRLKQHSWHYAKSLRSKKDIKDHNRRPMSTLSKRSERCGLKKETRLSVSSQRASSTKPKKLAERKLTLWEYVFGPRRSSENPCAFQLSDGQEQTRCEKDSRHQATSKDVLNFDPTKSSKDPKRLVEPQPKPPPFYKLPRAVLLSRAMVEGFVQKDCEGKVETPAPARKPYEEMRPASNIKGIAKHRQDIRSEDVKPHRKSTYRRVSIPTGATEARVDTARILRQAMSREEPRMHSRTERLKILVNEKMSGSQRAPRTDLERKSFED